MSQNPQNITNGETIRKVYENIISDSSIQTTKKPLTSRPRYRNIPQRIQNYRKKIPFNRLQYFRAILNDDIDYLKTINFTGNDLNTLDQYGWSGLMMASCEGSKKVTEFLLNCQVDTTIADSKGFTALTLAKRKNNEEIINLIEAKLNHNQLPYRNESNDDVKMCEINSEIKPFYCKQCQRSFGSITPKKHSTSTLHLFNERNRYQYSQRYGIPDSNVGFQMMIKQGWDREVGLGPRQEGKLFPIKTTLRKSRSGLGTKQEPARITHFVAHDRDAVKWKPTMKPKTRRSIEKDFRQNRHRERLIRNDLS